MRSDGGFQPQFFSADQEGSLRFNDRAAWPFLVRLPIAERKTADEKTNCAGNQCRVQSRRAFAERAADKTRAGNLAGLFAELSLVWSKGSKHSRAANYRTDPGC